MKEPKYDMGGSDWTADVGIRSVEWPKGQSGQYERIETAASDLVALFLVADDEVKADWERSV